MTHEPIGSVKGVVIKSRLAFVQAQMGEEAAQSVLAKLSPEDQKALSMIMSNLWYPFSVNERLDTAIAAEMGMGERVFKMMGEKSAEQNLGTVHRALIANRDPQGLLKRSAQIYQMYYNTGRREYEKLSEKAGKLTTRDSQTFSHPDCLTVVGWHEKAIGMCGGRNARVTESKCRARGDAVCEYMCEWE